MNEHFSGRARRAGIVGMALCSALALGACASSGTSVSGSVYAMQEPPPRLTVTRPAPPGPSAVWIPGQWRWNGYRYVWLPGYWELHPRGAWVPGHWQHTPRGWIWVYGYWR